MPFCRFSRDGKSFGGESSRKLPTLVSRKTDNATQLILESSAPTCTEQDLKSQSDKTSQMNYVGLIHWIWYNRDIRWQIFDSIFIHIECLYICLWCFFQGDRKNFTCFRVSATSDTYRCQCYSKASTDLTSVFVDDSKKIIFFL